MLQNESSLVRHRRKAETSWPLAYIFNYGALDTYIPFFHKSDIKAIIYCCQWKRRGLPSSKLLSMIHPSILVNHHPCYHLHDHHSHPHRFHGFIIIIINRTTMFIIKSSSNIMISILASYIIQPPHKYCFKFPSLPLSTFLDTTCKTISPSAF